MRFNVSKSLAVAFVALIVLVIAAAYVVSGWVSQEIQIEVARYQLNGWGEYPWSDVAAQVSYVWILAIAAIAVFTGAFVSAGIQRTGERKFAGPKMRVRVR